MTLNILPNYKPIEKELALGSELVAIGSSNILMNGKMAEEIRIESLAEKILNYMESKDKVYLSDLVEYFEEPANKIAQALDLLRKKGKIEEAN